MCFLGMWVSMFMIICLHHNVIASNNNEVDKFWNEIRTNTITFAENINPEKQFEVCNIFQVLNSDREVIGYCVGISSELDNWGYVIVEAEESGIYVKEAVIQQGINNLVYDYTDKINLPISNIFFDSIALVDVNGEYHLLWVEDKKAIEFDLCGTCIKESTVHEKERKVRVFSGYSLGIQSTIVKKVPSNLKCVSYKLLTYRHAYSENYIKEKTKKYSCGVIAMLEVAAQNHILDSDITKNFNTLWKMSGTTVYKKEKYNNKTIEYGETEAKVLGKVVVKYAKSKGKRNSSQYYNKVPTYEYIYSMIGKQYSIILNYAAKDKAKKQSAHSVSVVGAYKYKDSSNKKYKYLLVADGWHSTYSYIRFDNLHYEWCSTNGIYIGN